MISKILLKHVRNLNEFLTRTVQRVKMNDDDDDDYENCFLALIPRFIYLFVHLLVYLSTFVLSSPVAHQTISVTSEPIKSAGRNEQESTRWQPGTNTSR